MPGIMQLQGISQTLLNRNEDFNKIFMHFKKFVFHFHQQKTEITFRTTQYSNCKISKWHSYKETRYFCMHFLSSQAGGGGGVLSVPHRFLNQTCIAEWNVKYFLLLFIFRSLNSKNKLDITFKSNFDKMQHNLMNLIIFNLVYINVR